MEETGGLGPVGFCICPKCGYRKPHVARIPCHEETCPKCGSRLIREGSIHQRRLLKKEGSG